MNYEYFYIHKDKKNILTGEKNKILFDNWLFIFHNIHTLQSHARHFYLYFFSANWCEN